MQRGQPLLYFFDNLCKRTFDAGVHSPGRLAEVVLNKFAIFANLSRHRDTSGVKSIYDAEYRELITKLTAIRKAKPLTQKELAKLLDWDHTFVSKVENCVRRLDVIEMLKICRILGVKLRDLIEE